MQKKKVRTTAFEERIRFTEGSIGLKPGGTIVEGTAGNTGIGLAVGLQD